MKLKVEDAKVIEEGVKQGIIERVELSKRGGFSYVDVIIIMNDVKFPLRVSYPANLSKATTLGRLLQRMSVSMKVGADVELDVLVDRKVTFMLEKDKRVVNGVEKEFWNVSKESVMPLP